MEENKTGISFSSTRARVLIFKSTLRALKMPKHIRFLLNVKNKKIAVQVCEAIDRDAFKVPDFKETETYEISSIHFVNMIYRLSQWDASKTYRLKGNLFEENRLVEFDLNKADIIQDEDFVDPEMNK